MPSFLSRHCDYALQALLVLATRKDEGWTNLLEITRQLDVPEPFLAKILQDLSRKGLLISHKGPQGGFKLARAAESISLFDVISVVDGTGILKNCFMGFPDCSSDNPCPIHESWRHISYQVEMMLRNNSIADLVINIHKPKPL